VHWIVPMICTVPFGTGMLYSYQAVFIYLGASSCFHFLEPVTHISRFLVADAYRPAAASAMAANSATRSCFAAAFPLFTT
jgi:hypothetical protein